MGEPTEHPDGLGPYDTPLAAGLRFVTEIASWIAGPWAVADLTGSGWAAVGSLIILLGLPAIFSTNGDKKQVVVPTPGPVRFALEIALLVIAVIGAWVVWPIWLAVAVTIAVVGALLSGRRRARWLLDGAPLPV